MIQELRQLLGNEPSIRAFESILNHLLEWQDEDTIDIAIDYAVQHLDAWPNTACRVASGSAEFFHLWPNFTKERPSRIALLLRSFEMRYAGLPDVAKAIAREPYMANLRRLAICGNRILCEGLEAIANSPYMANLTSLDIKGNTLGNRGVIALANSPTMSNLTVLELDMNPLISLGGIQALAQSHHMRNLMSLALCDCALTDTCVEPLVYATTLTNLNMLHLEGNDISGEMLGRIKANPLFAHTTVPF